MKTIIMMVCLMISLSACSNEKDKEEENTENPIEVSNQKAEVTEVSFTGNENQYTLNVTIKSPDTGCDQYADWWEVVTPEGQLIYRRILAHSHVNEQPFSRTGGPVAITKDQEVYVRAHMNTSGYGTKVYKGNIMDGFISFVLEFEFDSELEKTEPLSSGCAF